MKLRLYFDEDSMDQTLIRALALRGVDVESALSCGMLHCTDQEQLDYATADGRVLYSFNVGDSCRLHAEFIDQGRTHAGIIVARQQHFPIGEQLRRLLRIATTLSVDDMNARLEFLSSW